MKRSQVNEESCGHWEYEDQYPIVHLEEGAVVQSLVPRNFGAAIRRVRLLRAASRDFAAGITLVGTAGVGEAANLAQRARMDEIELVMDDHECRRRVSFPEDSTDEKPSGSHDESTSDVCAGYGVLYTAEDPMFAVEVDHVLGNEVVAAFSQAVPADSLQGLTSGADEPQLSVGEGNGDKENWDPLGFSDVAHHRSPLPEWFPRSPLQDITNILSSNLDDEQPQPKKKRSKKLGVTQAPALSLLRGTLAQKTRTTTISKPLNCATQKNATNLRMNFR